MHSPFAHHCQQRTLPFSSYHLKDVSTPPFLFSDLSACYKAMVKKTLENIKQLTNAWHLLDRCLIKLIVACKVIVRPLSSSCQVSIKAPAEQAPSQAALSQLDGDGGVDNFIR